MFKSQAIASMVKLEREMKTNLRMTRNIKLKIQVHGEISGPEWSFSLRSVEAMSCDVLCLLPFQTENDLSLVIIFPLL